MTDMPYQIGSVKHSGIRADFLPDTSDAFWQLKLLLDFTIDCPAGRFVIPSGFISDGASIRFRAVSVVLARYGRRSLLAALVHDWFYSDGRHLIPDGIGDRRLWCDRLFREILNAAEVDDRSARLAYRAVRIFGDTVWGDDS